MSFECRANNFPAGWRKTVNQWARLNDRYFAENSDLPAWYVENSNSALFSAAAWMTGYAAICEVDVDKRKDTGKPGRPKNYGGRVDMEIQMGDCTYWVEAKRKCFEISETSRYALRHSYLSAGLLEAQNDIENVRDNDVSSPISKVSMTFFAGYIPEDAPCRTGENVIQRRSELVDEEVHQHLSNIKKLKDETGQDVYTSVFSQSDLSISKFWSGCSFPVLFGVCAIIDQ